MSAEQFVDEIRDEGGELELRDELITDDENKELYGYAVELAPLEGADLAPGPGSRTARVRWPLR